MKRKIELTDDDIKTIKAEFTQMNKACPMRNCLFCNERKRVLEKLDK